MIRTSTDDYNNGISHYIECREGWDRLLDIESRPRAKIRDTDDEFVGADFRDDEDEAALRLRLRATGLRSGFGAQTFKQPP